MTQDRYDIARLVMLGQLDLSYITLEEAIEVYNIATDRAIELELDQLAKSNPCVFYGIAGSSLPN